jgi:hypothetical protein
MGAVAGIVASQSASSVSEEMALRGRCEVSLEAIKQGTASVEQIGDYGWCTRAQESLHNKELMDIGLIVLLVVLVLGTMISRGR